jgi:hypothetical protein
LPLGKGDWLYPVPLRDPLPKLWVLLLLPNKPLRAPTGSLSFLTCCDYILGTLNYQTLVFITLTKCWIGPNPFFSIYNSGFFSQIIKDAIEIWDGWGLVTHS